MHREQRRIYEQA